METKKFSHVWESSWLWISSWIEATLKSLCLFPRGGRNSPGQMFPSQARRQGIHALFFLPLVTSFFTWHHQTLASLLIKMKVWWDWITVRRYYVLKSTFCNVWNSSWNVFLIILLYIFIFFMSKIMKLTGLSLSAVWICWFPYVMPCSTWCIFAFQTADWVKHSVRLC